MPIKLVNPYSNHEMRNTWKKQSINAFFESGNSDDLAKKINKMLENRENIEKMGKSAKEFSKKFNKEDYYKKLEEIYKKLTS